MGESPGLACGSVATIRLRNSHSEIDTTSLEAKAFTSPHHGRCIVHPIPTVDFQV